MPVRLPKILRTNSRRLYLKEELIPSLYSQLKTKVPLCEKTWSYITASLAAFGLLLIFLTQYQPAQELISPLVNSLHLPSSKAFAHSVADYQKFSFIPGWAVNKYDDIDFSSAPNFAFYDVPVNDDGTLATDTIGYANFRSPEAQTLFQEIHDHHAKAFVTLSLSTNDEITTLLDNPDAQQQLITQAIAEVSATGIDGVVIDFEFSGNGGSEYSAKYTTFIVNFTHQLQQQVPGSEVHVALSSTAPSQPFYDVRSLAGNSQGIFLMAYDFALPESKNNVTSAPVYGYESDSYWKDVTTKVDSIQNDIADDKLTVETAWYGNGDNYPFYQSLVSSNSSQADNSPHNTLKTPLSRDVIEGLVSEVPSSAQDAARKNLPLIAKALEHEGILTPNVLSYALATIEHETAGTFEPIEEFNGRTSARRLGYEGGTNYFGRGFIQLTHLRNYKSMGERIGMGDALAQHPELASDPEVAAKVLAAFFKDNNVANLASKGYFIDARRPVNPDANGYWIAQLAWKYRNMLG